MNANLILRSLVILYCSSIPLNLIFNNLHELGKNSYYDLIQPLCIFGLIFIFMYWVEKKTEKKDLFYGLFLINFIFFFNFKEAFNLIDFISPYTRLTVIILVYLLSIVAVYSFYKLARLMNFLIIFLGAMIIYSLSIWSINSFSYLTSLQKIPKSSVISTSKNKSNGGFNVYYIIADGLTDSKNFKRMTGDHLLLPSQLKQYGFIDIINSRSNYVGSASSIASIFHLDYFRNSTSTLTNPADSSYYPSILYSEQSSLYKVLKNNNYNLRYFPAWYSSCIPGKSYQCIKESFVLNKVSLKIFDNSLISYLENKSIGAKFNFLLRREVDALKNLNRFILNNNYDNKNFFFIHHMQPHDPYFFDSNCAHISTNKFTVSVNYSNSVECLTKNLLVTVNNILSKDPGAFIIIQGDHGWTLKEDASLLESAEYYNYRSSITNVIKPNKFCEVPQNHSMGPINSARLIVSCINNNAYDRLPEITYIPGTNYSETGRLIKR